MFVTIRSTKGNISSPLDPIYSSWLVTLTEVISFSLTDKSLQGLCYAACWAYISLLTATYLLLPKIFLMCSVISLLVLSSTSTKTCSPLSAKKDLYSSSVRLPALPQAAAEQCKSV